MLVTSLGDNLFTRSQMYSSSWPSVLNSLFEKSLLNLAHIFSAGFNSGLYGGRKIRIIFSGIIKDFALWKAPLSSTIIFNSSGFCKENSFRTIRLDRTRI